MHQPGFLHPAFAYLLGAVAAGLCALVYFLCRMAVRPAVKPQPVEPGPLERELADLKTRVRDLTSQMQETTERSHLLVPSVPLQSGLNLNKRSVALNMHRRGEAPAQIAAALNIPRNEVELLLKVHRLVVSHF